MATEDLVTDTPAEERAPQEQAPVEQTAPAKPAKKAAPKEAKKPSIAQRVKLLFHFPTHAISVEATSLEEAIKKLGDKNGN